jgi:hypothetical protein
MATLAGNNLTLTDFIKRQDPNGQHAKIIEMLTQQNPILEDMTWLMGNTITGLIDTVRTGLPTPAWRKLNQGVQPTKSTTRQVEWGCGMMEDWCQTDAKLVDLQNDKGNYLLGEAEAHLQGMAQEMASKLFYGNLGDDAEAFAGFSEAYATLDEAEAASARNILDLGGVGTDNTSIWLVCWSDRTTTGIFPKNTQAGISRDNKGVVTSEVNGTLMDVYREKFAWDAGLAIRDWRYNARIANIDVTNLQANGQNIIEAMVKATHLVESMNVGKYCFYCSRTTAAFLDLQAMNKSNAYLTVGGEEGDRKVMLRGVPVKTCDAILDTEDAIS